MLHFRDYIKSIIDWVGRCIDAYGTDDVFRGGLEQYKQAMIGFLNDYRLALDLKAVSARYPEEAFVFWNTRNEADTSREKIIKDQFIHVKWHAVHEFYSKLKIGMEKSFGVAVSDIGNEEITAVTHRDSKTRIALGFAYNGKNYYVCNDRRGLALGSIS